MLPYRSKEAAPVAARVRYALRSPRPVARAVQLVVSGACLASCIVSLWRLEIREVTCRRNEGVVECVDVRRNGFGKRRSETRIDGIGAALDEQPFPQALLYVSTAPKPSAASSAVHGGETVAMKDAFGNESEGVVVDGVDILTIDGKATVVADGTSHWTIGDPELTDTVRAFVRGQEPELHEVTGAPWALWATSLFILGWLALELRKLGRALVFIVDGERGSLEVIQTSPFGHGKVAMLKLAEVAQVEVEILAPNARRVRIRRVEGEPIVLTTPNAGRDQHATCAQVMAAVEAARPVR